MKEKRECWLLQEFCRAFSNEIAQKVEFECGERDSSDGRLIVEDNEIPVQIVTADGVRYVHSAWARSSNQVVVYDVDIIECIKHALEIKVNKNYTDVGELTLLIEYSALGSVNFEYLSKELADVKIQNFVKKFREVYILSPSDNDAYVKRHPPQKEAILFKIPVVN